MVLKVCIGLLSKAKTLLVLAIMSEQERTLGYKNQGVKITASQQMISSCSGAVLTSLFVTPLDVVKIRLQAQKKPGALTSSKCVLYCNELMDPMCACLSESGHTVPTNTTHIWYKRPGHFTGTLDAFIKISRYEGIASLWSGLPPTLVMAVPATVVYFTSYEQLKALIGYKDHNGNDWWKPMTCGSIARVWAATVSGPLELVRTKMQSVQLTYKEVGKAVKTSIKNDGVVSLWRGLGPTLLRDVPFSAVYWLGYESTKAEVLKLQGSSELTFMQSFLSGAIAGTVAAVITLPFDVIKTHRQIELGQESTLDVKSAPASTWRLIQRLYVSEGFLALFAGLVPRIIKVAPACAIMISTYEYFKTFFYNRNLLNNA